MYLTGQLTFEEVKVHCCENLLLNILDFMQHLTGKGDNHYSSSGFVNSSVRTKMAPLGHLELT